MIIITIMKLTVSPSFLLLALSTTHNIHQVLARIGEPNQVERHLQVCHDKKNWQMLAGVPATDVYDCARVTEEKDWFCKLSLASYTGTSNDGSSAKESCCACGGGAKPTNTAVKVNAGGVEPYTDGSGNVWQADEFLTGRRVAEMSAPKTLSTRLKMACSVVAVECNGIQLCFTKSWSL